MIYAQRLALNFGRRRYAFAVYVHNRCPAKVVEGKTPKETWSARMPHVTHICIFGCVTYVKVSDQMLTKLDQGCQVFVPRILQRHEGISAHMLGNKEYHQECKHCVFRKTQRIGGFSKWKQ